LHEATRRERVAAAKLRELELAEKVGSVTANEETCKAVAAEYHVIRAGFLAMANKLAHPLAAAGTPEKCGLIVDSEVRAILTALTEDRPQ
jgi:hypothetical protein